MADVLALYRSFVRVVESGSFTAVGRELNSSQPTISRQIAALEDHLGCLLFQRSTRALTLTDDGQIFYDHARRALETIAEAEGAVGRRRSRPTGSLRLAAAGVFGRLHVIPRLPRFREKYPDITLSLRMNDDFSDLVGEGVDLALRIGTVADTGLIARRIGLSHRIVVATPDYLARRGIPRHPDDLAGHDCILYERLQTGTNWTFATPDGPLTIAVDGPFRANNTEGVRAAVLEGLGIGYVPLWHFTDGEIESGQLTVLLADFAPPPQPISAVYPSRRYLSSKVRAAIDFFAAEFQSEPRLRNAN